MQHNRSGVAFFRSTGLITGGVWVKMYREVMAAVTAPSELRSSTY